jgi:putative endonuclease
MALRFAWKVVKSAELKKLLGHSKMKEWSVYIIRCRDRSLYTGISTDVQRRFGEHISGGRTAAKYTKSFSSTELAYEIPIGKRSLAAKIEYRIKNLPKQKKEFIVLRRFSRDELIKFIEPDQHSHLS